MFYTTYFNDYSEEIILASDGKFITGLWFKEQKYFPDIKLMSKNNNLYVFNITKKWLDIYFSGKEPDFIPETYLKGTPFQNAVWEILKKIPYGKTISYSDVGKKLNIKSYRAIGSAIGRNPISIIVPCHRVIGKNGSLTGYAAGIDKKMQLLKLERIL